MRIICQFLSNVLEDSCCSFWKKWKVNSHGVEFQSFETLHTKIVEIFGACYGLLVNFYALNSQFFDALGIDVFSTRCIGNEMCVYSFMITHNLSLLVVVEMEMCVKSIFHFAWLNAQII